MQIIQIIIILFGLFAFSRTFLRFKESKINRFSFLFWSVVWISVIIVAIIPATTRIFTKISGVGRGVDFLVYTSIIILFYLVFKLYVKIEKIEQEITEIVKNISLKELKRRK